MSEGTEVGVAGREDAVQLVRAAARLMLEYNVRSAVLAARVRRLGDALGTGVDVWLAYRQATLHFDDGRTFHLQVPEYRLNVAISSGVGEIIDRVCDGVLSPRDALAAMHALEKTGRVHRRWALALMFALAASASRVHPARGRRRHPDDRRRRRPRAAGAAGVGPPPLAPVLPPLRRRRDRRAGRRARDSRGLDAHLGPVPDGPRR